MSDLEEGDELDLESETVGEEDEEVEEEEEEEEEGSVGGPSNDNEAEEQGGGTAEGEVKGLTPLSLTKELAGGSLSLLCKTGSGLAHAYVRIILKDKGLTDIALLERYIHLRYVDLCNNHLDDISCLGCLPHLLVIKADHNKLTSAHLPELKYLQIASFSHNLITTTEDIDQPMLETLILSSNKISQLSGLHSKNLPCLHVLDLSSNLLHSTAGIHLPNLQRLYLSSNQLSQCDELQGLSHLNTLHLRDNHIANLDGFAPSLSSLKYINLRGNHLDNIQELSKLKSLPLLRTLVLLDTPLPEMDDYRIEVCLILRKLERLDKDSFTEDDRADAEELYEQRHQESPEPDV